MSAPPPTPRESAPFDFAALMEAVRVLSQHPLHGFLVAQGFDRDLHEAVLSEAFVHEAADACGVPYREMDRETGGVRVSPHLPGGFVIVDKAALRPFRL